MYTNTRLGNRYILDEDDFNRIARLVHDRAGISLNESKKALVHARLSKLLRKRGLAGFGEYIALLDNDPDGVELTGLLDAIATNFTHFFRERQHYDYLVGHLNSSSGMERVTIWSAGCSSGEEPYSIAICLAEHTDVSADILATDLSTRVLAKARDGVYPLESVAKVDPDIVKKYFLRGRNGSTGLVKVKPSVAGTVTFRQLNFMEPFSFDMPFDVIFCRNVMIYFDQPTKTRLVGRFHDCLAPGGLLIIGHSESLKGLTTAFDYIQPTIYRRI